MRACVCVHACERACACVCVCVCVCVCQSMNECVCLCVPTWVCARECAHVCFRAYVRVRTCMHANICMLAHVSSCTCSTHHIALSSFTNGHSLKVSISIHSEVMNVTIHLPCKLTPRNGHMSIVGSEYEFHTRPIASSMNSILDYCLWCRPDKEHSIFSVPNVQHLKATHWKHCVDCLAISTS